MKIGSNYLMDVATQTVKGLESCETARVGVFQRTFESDNTAAGLSLITRTFASQFDEDPIAPS